MNRRALILGVSAVACLALVGGGFVYLKRADKPLDAKPRAPAERLVRMHSPVFGPVDAPVTIAEFFDPSCEACRAFYPYVKQILAEFPREVRLVLRYAPFHEGSDQAVMLLEAARSQGKYQEALEALLERQPEWATHGAPNLALAWEAAEKVGVDVEAARTRIANGTYTAQLRQDVDDLNALEVHRTPTFYVNGQLLENVGPQQLYELVVREVNATRSAVK